MNTTTIYKLKKPEGTDLVDIDDLNANFDTIDSQLASKEGALKNAAAKTTLADADTLPLSDSAAASATKKITFANLKAALKTYFDTLYNKYTHPTYTSKAAGLYKVTVDSTGHVSATTAVAKADITALGIPSTNTTYGNMTGATSSAAGASGLVPAPAAGKQTSYLRGDGTWVVPPNTTYGNMTGATASAAGKAGLAPAPAAGAQAKYLRGDGTWQTPPNTTYGAATTSANGLMSAADKTKLDGVATGANKTIVDTALSSSSTNPVQNKVVNTALAGKAPAYSYGTEDLTAGTSALATGKLHFVYE